MKTDENHIPCKLLNVMNNLMVPYNDGLADAMESYLKFAQMLVELSSTT